MANAVPTLGYLEPFDPKVTTWESWSERPSVFFLANGVKANEKERRSATFLSLIGSSTYELLRTLVHPQVPATLELKDFLATLKAHFSPQTLVIAERFKLHQRSQRDGESVVEFLAALRNFSSHCEFGVILVDARRDRFVCGLRGSNS